MSSTAWNVLGPLAGTAIGFVLSKADDWWRTRPKGYLQWDGGGVLYVDEDNICVPSKQATKVFFMIKAHVVNRSGTPMSIVHPRLYGGRHGWSGPGYDLSRSYFSSDTIPPHTGRNYIWVFVFPQKEIDITWETQYVLRVDRDRGSVLEASFHPAHIIMAVDRGDPVTKYLEWKGW